MVGNSVLDLSSVVVTSGAKNDKVCMEYKIKKIRKIKIKSCLKKC